MNHTVEEFISSIENTIPGKEEIGKFEPKLPGEEKENPDEDVEKELSWDISSDDFDDDEEPKGE